MLSKPEIMAEFHHMCVPTHIIPGKQKHMQSQMLYYVSAQNYSPMLLQKAKRTCSQILASAYAQIKWRFTDMFGNAPLNLVRCLYADEAEKRRPKKKLESLATFLPLAS